MTEAMLYEKLSEQRVHCYLCAHNCVIENGKNGFCNVRQNRDGTLYTLVYGRTIAQHNDVIEKKPLYHFHPGSHALSVATPGCNFRCRWCQNCEISQAPTAGHLAQGIEASPEGLVKAALGCGSRSIAYTYTEPTVFFEYSYETAVAAHKNNLANVYVTNGFMTKEMLQTLHPCLDAAAVDLKAFRNETYKKYAGARLQPVLDSMKRLKEYGTWLEVITLVIPDLNDDPAELRDIAGFIRDELGPETPWHLSRFMPAYKMTGVPPTPAETLKRAKSIGLEEGLKYVYLGNLSGHSDTYCSECGQVLVERSGYSKSTIKTTEDGKCSSCNTPLAGVGMGRPA
ncbi:MAG: AmmeMemoRadiSam system radical SAM enzyme [Lentisphaeria bacterium]